MVWLVSSHAAARTPLLARRLVLAATTSDAVPGLEDSADRGR